METRMGFRLTLGDVETPDPETLEQEETQSQGQAADLKRETYVVNDGVMWLVRWWLNRVGRADGAEHAVEVEARVSPDGCWRVIGGYGVPRA